MQGELDATESGVHSYSWFTHPSFDIVHQSVMNDVVESINGSIRKSIQTKMKHNTINRIEMIKLIMRTNNQKKTNQMIYTLIG